MESPAQGRAEVPGSDIHAHVRTIQSELSDYARSLERDPNSIRLCGVTKRQSREAVLEAVAAGITDIGESYVQEASAKLAGITGVTKHFIGHLQTNKAKAIVSAFDVVQSIDRPEAGDAIAKACNVLGLRVRTLVQVNISPNDRFGVAPQAALALADYLRKLDLEVDGIMAIGPNTDDRDTIRRSFEEAASLFSQIGGSTLSIGMSGDWREAVACGSTMIRIGTALFGARPPVLP
jgi:pyridoxal phosphate enzyme (YggS family)